MRTTWDEAKEYLRERYGREPTNEEIDKYLTYMNQE